MALCLLRKVSIARVFRLPRSIIDAIVDGDKQGQEIRLWRRDLTSEGAEKQEDQKFPERDDRFGNEKSAAKLLQQKLCKPSPFTLLKDGKSRDASGVEEEQRVLQIVEELLQKAQSVSSKDLPESFLNFLREGYSRLQREAKERLIRILALNIRGDSNRLSELMQSYLERPTAVDDSGNSAVAARQLRLESSLRSALSPRPVRLLEAICAQAGGLQFLLRLRCDLRSIPRWHTDAGLLAVDELLKRLFATWLSPACLELRQITWNDSAVLLEKIVAYEAVHPVRSLADLKRRLGSGRRCFAYFHPAIPGEPLVFMEAALTANLSHSIELVLENEEVVEEEKATAAVFYSISNTQEGLAGIHLGNFLIKRALNLLKQELPQLQTFATLSPIPGFCDWLRALLSVRIQNREGMGAVEMKEKDKGEGVLSLLLPDEEAALAQVSMGMHPEEVLLGALTEPLWRESSKRASAALEGPLMRLCAGYLVHEKKRGFALDPVANFHLRNGASLERLNWMADSSRNGLDSSAGIMVNYLYRTEDIDKNHEAYVRNGSIVTSSRVLAFLYNNH